MNAYELVELGDERETEVYIVKNGDALWESHARLADWLT